MMEMGAEWNFEKLLVDHSWPDPSVMVIAQPAPAQNVVLKLGTLAPEGTSWVKAFRDINRELEQKTNKQVSLRFFPGGILGDEEDMLRKVKVGQIQGALLTGGGLGLIFKDIKILAIPFLFQNYKEVDAVLEQNGRLFPEGICRTMVSSPWGGPNRVSFICFPRNRSGMPRTCAKGKVWIWEDTAMGRAVFKELGVNAIPLSITDILMALQTGMIDTVYSSPLAAISSAVVYEGFLHDRCASGLFGGRRGPAKIGL